MIENHKWGTFKGWKIRVNAAWRCLRKSHYVLVCWDRCEDGQLDFKISHKGVELTEAVHRLGVDAVEILEDIRDQNDALDEVHEMIK